MSDPRLAALVAQSDISNGVLEPGTTLLKTQYTIEKYLSAGGFGITYLATDSLARRVVIKECFPEAICSRKQKTVSARKESYQSEFRSFVTMFVKEAHSLSKLKHPNVVGVHQVFEDNDTAYMALDLVDGQDLLTIIEDEKLSLTPQVITDVLLKMLDAIAVIHNQDMLHRDISPDNILVDQSGTPVLIDFGAAREEASKKSRTLSSVLVVKDGYSPQEFYFGGSLQGRFSDIYALGATFYHLVSGTAPPHSQARLSEIAAGGPDPCVPLADRFPEFDRGFLVAIDRAMSVFPKDRYQTAENWRMDITGEPAPKIETVAIDTSSIRELVSEVNDEVANETVSVSIDNYEQRKPHSVDLSALKRGPPEKTPLPRARKTERTTRYHINRRFARLVAMAVLITVVSTLNGRAASQAFSDLQTAISSTSGVFIQEFKSLTNAATPPNSKGIS